MISHKLGFAVCYPVKLTTSKEIGQCLEHFCHDFGVPSLLKSDGHPSQVGHNAFFQSVVRKYNIKHTLSEPYRAHQNPAESTIRELKMRSYQVMFRKRVPKRLWDYGLIWICETMNISVSSSRYAKGRTPIEAITGETPDISEYTDFGFYDWVLYRDNAGLGETKLGRWLGVLHKIGQLMSYYVLPIGCKVISCVTVQRLTRADQSTREFQQRMDEYDAKVGERLGINNPQVILLLQGVPNWNRLSLDKEDSEFISDFQQIIDDKSIADTDIFEDDKATPDTFDGYINMQIGLPRGADDELIKATVKRRKTDTEGESIGKRHNNPLLDSREYEVEFIDGSVETITANVITENLLSQVDDEGHCQMLLHDILDHRKLSNALSDEDAAYTTKYGSTKRSKTTVRWEICVEWKDGSFDWVSLKDLKHAYPVELADYAVRQKINEEPTFAWWVPYVLKKRKSIIAKIKSKYWDRTHKYGFRIPKTVAKAYAIDEENNNNLWRSAIEEEMKKIRAAITLHHGDTSQLIGFQQISVHLIFDIKLGENFRCKA